ncbi:FecR domain-containing protein [Delftia lacustris]|uniref:Transmembrane sensor n=1 Tax=Delftia lacustris TaxID=558537 RepID=A0A1H3NYB7_9BURK|nr:FecR domain-containing protein [Delftia lacustris]SDY93884.1 transmembrane sensor [Delftia lacustris]
MGEGTLESNDRRALHEAAAWHVKLRGTAVTPSLQQAWTDWHEADPAHQRAWLRVQSVTAQLSHLPAPLARQALGRRSDPNRRSAVRAVALGLGSGATAWLAWKGAPLEHWQAAHRTATGERRDLTLPDGSLVALDTATSVDVAFDDRQRLLRLYRGRILVATGPDALGRPFSVQTPQGHVLALGTRFTVHVADDGLCHVNVQEKTVRLQPLDSEATPTELQAGQHAAFSASAAQPPASADPFAASWHEGGLIALDMPLGQLIDALARYRPGYLGCTPEVAGLRVSGAFPVDDTDRALAALVSRFPLQLSTRTRYWVQVQARSGGD